MREQLISYVDLLFAGAEDADDIKQEILQNTLDRYDDLIDQGKSPQAAYSLAISGIGDISEILEHSETAPAPLPASPTPTENKNKKAMRAVAIGMYICCALPVIILSNVGFDMIGVVLMFLMIAAATVLLILSDDGKKAEKADCGCHSAKATKTPQRKAVEKIISTVGLCAYFLLSFGTGAWYITWLIFPIMAALEQLINACIDLKEGR